jgi:Zn2+/Cd2+-exporting ATPase
MAGSAPPAPIAVTDRAKIDLPLLLPEVPDARDACVERVEAMIQDIPGVVKTHVVSGEGNGDRLCVHFDPAMITLADVERRAHSAGADVTKRYGHVVLPIRAVDGEDAGRRIENTLLDTDGVLVASANLAAQRVRIEYDRGRISRHAIEHVLEDLGYAVGQPGHVHVGACCRPKEAVEEKAPWHRHHRELIWSLTAGVLLVSAFIGELFFGLPRQAAVAGYAAAYVFGGYDIVRHWVGTLRRGRWAFDIDLLMLLAAGGAAILGEWAEGALLLFLFSLAHALEHYALGRARNAIRSLAELAPANARVLRDGHEVDVPVERVLPDEMVVVRPGERIPVDGEVHEGLSSVDQAPITGESVPVEKGPGTHVFAGTINGDGALVVSTTRAAGDRTLDRVVRLVEEAQTQKAPTQRFTERFERIFVPSALVAVVLLMSVPALAGWLEFSESFYRSMALLVAASPCALALGTPATVLAGIAQAARRGVLIKGGAYLEHLGSIRALAIDKTGTLTFGDPEVTDVLPAQGVEADELLAVAAAVERRSQHPLARAVVRRAEAEGLSLLEAGPLQNVTSRGVRSSLNGETVEVGNLRLWAENGSTPPPEIRETVEALGTAGKSVMVVRRGTRWLGTIGVADRPREGIKQVIERLRAQGIYPILMLTGDNRGVAEAVGREVGVDAVHAELLPEDKLELIQQLRRDYGDVAMVGDGVNDAPALAHANVGIAMGGAGTDVALETADVALMADDLSRLPFAVGLSRRARTIIRQNLFIALGVIFLLIIATSTGLIGLGPAVVVHEGSTLVVIANALRLLRYGGE